MEVTPPPDPVSPTHWFSAVVTVHVDVAAVMAVVLVPPVLFALVQLWR